MTATSDTVASPAEACFDAHQAVLENARTALTTRNYRSPYPEIPSGKIYGPTAAADGQAAFEQLLGKPFELDQPGSGTPLGEESSPYGLSLGITYPKPDLDALLAAAQAAIPAWRDATVAQRTGVCLEILHRLNRHSFELAHAVMHTTGQSFMMAFQAGGPHAQDRGLEALAVAYNEMTRLPAEVTWEKQVGKDKVEQFRKTHRIVPRGVGVVVACSTFPTWNTYPALFANLATGNAVIIKPHPGAILPLAITVRIARTVLAECGFDPNGVTLAADTTATPITKDLVTRPEVGLIDYTGSTEFGNWIEANAGNALVFTEKAGVNSVVLDSVTDLKRVAGNLALSVCLYSGQMCTAPQNIFVPQDGITVDGQPVPFDQVAQAIVKAIDGLLSDEQRACDILGAIQNPRTLERIKQAAGGATVVRQSSPHSHPQFPEARIHSPVVLTTHSDDQDTFLNERFGPIVVIVSTRDTAESIALAARCARERGSITAAVYSTDAATCDTAGEALNLCGAPVCFNLTGQKLINHAAAFSDLHVSGLNPSGNATFCDSAFVSGRFRFVQTCSPLG